MKNLLTDLLSFSVAPTAKREVNVGLLSVLITALIVTILVQTSNVDPVLFVIPAVAAALYAIRAVIAARRSTTPPA